MFDRIAITKLLLELTRMGAIPEERARVLEQQFEDAQQERFDDFLLEEGLVSKEDLLKALSRVYQVPDTDVEGYFFKTHLLHMFPKDFLMRNGIIPMERDENILIVVASNPTNPDLLLSIGDHVSYDIRFLVGIYSDIIDAIEEYYDESLTEDYDQFGEDIQLELENKGLRVQDIEDLPVAEEDRDQSAFLKEKIDEFAKTETELEREGIEERAGINKRK